MERYFRLSRTEQTLVQFVLLAWASIVLLPLGIALINSLKPSLGEVYRDPMALPSVWSVGNYARAWTEANFSRYFVNSLVISLSSVVLVVLCASSTAYVLVRRPFPGSRWVLVCFLVGVVVPIRLALAPLFATVRALGLLDTLTGVVLVQAASMMPVAVFVFGAFLAALPKELEEAATMDGALPFTIYRRLVMPLMRPAVATVALLTFVQAWNEYFLPLIFLQSADNYPITLGIAEFRARFDVQWHLLFAGILIMLVPTVIAFLLASRQFIEGLTQGGLKE